MKHWLMAVLLGCAGLVARAEPPNVLLVLLDDLGYSDLGCYGGEIPTPNLDRMGVEGLRFTGMTTSARCCPSRASILTGLHPGQTGIPNFGGALVQNCATLAEVLGAAGYQTYAVGKWHVGNGPTQVPTMRGFDEFYGFPNDHSQDQWSTEKYVRLPKERTPEIKVTEDKFYATDVFTEYALEFLRQAEQKKKPWFLYLAHSAPHFPLQAPAASIKPLVETYRQGWDLLRSQRFEKMKQIGLIDHAGWTLTERSMVPVESNNAIANGYSGQPNPAWDSLEADRREDLAYRMATFAAMVKHVDDGIGRIIEQLKKAGSYENTVILVLSDNGACYEWGPFGFDGTSRKGETILHKGAELEQMGGVGTHMAYGSAWANLGNTPFRMYKHFAHQGGLATPFIVHWPAGVEHPGRWVRDPAHIVDIMPTLVDVAKAPYPAKRNGNAIPPMEGVSLAPAFKQGGALPPRALCYQHQGARAIRKGPWKLVLGKRAPGTIDWELYAIDKDPCETTDLAKQHPEVVQTLVKEWDAWAERTSAVEKPNSGKKKKKGKGE